MKIFNIHKVSAAVVAVSSLLAFAGPLTAFAVTATAPSLGAAASFSVLAGSAITADGSGATISGNLGISPGNSLTGTWTHTGGSDFLANGTAANAISAATGAWTTMGSTGGTTWNPVTDISPAPGLWTRSGDATFADTLTLNGSATDVWIFQITSSLTFTGTVNLTGGAQACNVFWRIASDATINSGGAGSKFVGTLIGNGNVSTVGGATVNGRLFALTGTLSTAGVTSITGPTGCATVATTGGGSAKAPPEPPTLTVIKHVIGGNKVASDFSLAVKIYGQNVAGSPAPGLEAGRIYQLTQTGTSTVSELPMAGYTSAFSGACNSKGEVFMDFGDKRTCTITNTAIALLPPLINVTKIPTPLALPGGAGSVTYDYTVLNLGAVAMSNVTVADDKCAAVSFVSGDTNGDSKLDTNETWKYRCVTTLSQTTTNTVTATGQANGLTASDVAQATVVVGAALTPPLIHVIKEPSVFVLPAGGGAVTYWYSVSNPGTVPLHNVSVTDNKCSGLASQLAGHPGDLNKNGLLDPNETWTFTCVTNLKQTTTNIGTATGDANGFTVVDLSPATVVVAPPKLPNTGVGSDEGSAPWNVVVLFGTLMAVAASLGLVLKKRAI